jgi:two-component system sensor histidine kinase LytS
MPDSFISIDKEIQHIHDYVKIEAARFAGKLQVECHIPADCQQNLPPLILQPIVENAIKHGLYPKREGGKVIISGWREAGKVMLAVEDDGVGMDAEQLAKALQPDPKRLHIGLSNVNSRLSSIYGKEYGLIIVSNPGMGTKVIIPLPAEGRDGDA